MLCIKNMTRSNFFFLIKVTHGMCYRGLKRFERRFEDTSAISPRKEYNRSLSSDNWRDKTEREEDDEGDWRRAGPRDKWGGFTCPVLQNDIKCWCFVHVNCLSGGVRVPEISGSSPEASEVGLVTLFPLEELHCHF